MALSLGTIDYLNTQPVEYGIAQRLPGVRVVRDVPTGINQALIEGRIAIGPISLYAFAQHTDDLQLVPGLSIATLGAVKSVLLFSWHSDPRMLDGLPVALTDHSATSVRLLQVLCEHYYHVAPQWYRCPQDVDAMLAHYEAALLIGDHALVEGVLHRAIGSRGVPYCFDLGQEWLDFSGLPFVFAVWAMRRECAEGVQRAGIVPALYASKVEGIQAIDVIAQAYAPRLGVPAEVCATYLRNLRYHLDARDEEGLRFFLDYALV